MKTKIIKINLNEIDRKKIEQAAKILKKGGIVAFPTETVYGLGAILDEEAIKKIFEAKGRPADNPLIVHIASLENLEELVEDVPEKARKLMEAFWAGPLTLVLKNKSVPEIVTAGLDSVAVRMPSNKIALELIKKTGPIAAPSANSSGKPSPTRAEHVIDDLNGKIDAVMDAGPVEIGLESTVISFLDEPVILRPGKISKEDIERIIGPVKLHPAVLGEKVDKPASPGMKYRHYSPKAQVILANKKFGEILNKLNSEKKKIEVIYLENVEEGTRELFHKFREADKKGAEVILVKAVEEKGLGLAVMNRLKKAASRIEE